MRSLEELVDVADPMFPLIEEWVAAASTPVTVLPVERAAAEATLLALQVTTRSGLGGLAFHTGGILVDGGWLRVLGGGSPQLPRSLATWNQIGAPQVRMPGAMLVGDDVLGGFFAVEPRTHAVRPADPREFPRHGPYRVEAAQAAAAD